MMKKLNNNIMNEEIPNPNTLTPSQTSFVAYQPDPDLCLTPDVRQRKSQSRKVRFREANVQNVEFDGSVNGIGQFYISEYNEPKQIGHAVRNKESIASNYPDVDELAVTISNCNVNGNETKNHAKTYSYMISELDESVEDRGVEIANDESKITIETTSKAISSSFENDVEIIVDRTGYNNHCVDSDFRYPFVESATDMPLEYNAFSRPEYNTTLRIGEEIKTLKSSRPDVMKAVTDKLLMSENLRTVIGEKAASRVNRSNQQFNDLVSVDVADAKIVQQAAREKQVKISRPAVQASKYPEPDLMEFFTDDLQKENLDLSLDTLGVHIPGDELSSADLSACYDIYIRNKVWDGH